MRAPDEYDAMASRVRQPDPAPSGGALDARALVRHATLAASSHNTQPWRFVLHDDAIVILPDLSRRCRVVDPDDRHLFRSLGCAAENLVHAAAAQGYAADVRFQPDPDRVVVGLRHDPSSGPTELSRAITRRQCTKTTYDGTLLRPAELERLQAAGAANGIRVIMLVSDEQKEAVIDYVTRGDIAQLGDRAFRDELASWIRFNPRAAMRTGDGLAGRTGGQPALPQRLGRWLLRLVLTPTGQAKADAQNLRSSAGVAVFVSRGDDKAAWVEAGRAYERFALTATALDIRTAFINQPIEVDPLRQQFESWLNLNGEHAELAVRFGHGPVAPFSLRRPIDEVIVEDARTDAMSR